MVVSFICLWVFLFVLVFLALMSSKVSVFATVVVNYISQLHSCLVRTGYRFLNSRE